ncbi:MAG: hypothetical protein J4G09_03660 [Proteobacteria bacterium]|nr:hypothetical protein [Pseudomonadota bacterium]
MANERERHERLMSGAAWEDFCERLKALGSEVLRDDVPDNPLDRAEGYRHLTRLLGYSLHLAVEHSDTDRPLFHPHPGLAWKWGGENPDNLYLHAAIDGRHSYRITGNRGSVHDFIVQAGSCNEMEAPGTGARRFRPTIVPSEIAAHEIEFDPDGGFEIWVGPDERPGHWLRSRPDTGWVNVRLYYRDWDREEPARFFIERVDFDHAPPPPLSPADLAERLDDALAWVEHGMPYWTGWTHKNHLTLPENSAIPLPQPDEGVAAIRYGVGRYDLEPETAMIFECEVPRASYYQVTLLNFWFETLDHANHQSCLNDHQIRPDPDGRFRLVISERDPGVPNWLDPAGHPNGLIQYRWVHSETNPEPSCRRVPLSELRDALPPETPQVTPEQRRESLHRRRRHVLRRYNLG